MTNKELHIGIDLSLKVFNHNLIGRFLSEEKDYILNNAINNLIHKTAEDARHSVINVESYADITAFYNILEPYLITRQLDVVANKGRYNEYQLPKFIDVLNTLGNEILAGVSYKVESVGNLNTLVSNLSSNYNGLSAVVEDDIFIIPNTNNVYTFVDPFYVFFIEQGFKYKIVRTDGIDFTQYGAANNNIGTVFTCNQDVFFASGDSDTQTTELEVISFTPSTWTDITLVVIKNLSIFEYIAINALISTNAYITKTNATRLIKGKYYRVVTPGAFNNLTSIGSAYNTVETNYVFVATASIKPVWATGSVAVLELLTDSSCRLIKPQDSGSFLEHAYGTTTTSPLITLGDNKVQVYHDNKFNIIRIELIYVRPPARIDSVTNIECDMNTNLHSTIVNLAVQEIVSTNNPQLYQTVNAQLQQK